MVSTPDQEGKCTCGHHVDKEGREQQQQQHGKCVSSNYGLHPERLDSSFVHLPPPSTLRVTSLRSPLLVGMDTSDADGLYNHGFGRAHDHINSLLDAMMGCTEGEKGNNGDNHEGMDCFCTDCIQRIASALDENTERLQLENQAYMNAIKEEEQKQTRLEKALSINLGVTDNKNTSPTNAINTADDRSHELSEEIKDDLVEGTVRAFQQEMKGLATSCKEHQNELKRLNRLLLDQVEIAEALTAEEDAVLSEFNALAIDARSFEDTHHRLTLQCHAADREVAALSCVRLHASLFDINVDERGLEYPLINDLRFSHRPNPDLNLRWEEINAAWSQAAQLLMFAASSMHFSSQGFKIVLLTTCAKIIEVRSTKNGGGRDKRIVHNLGHEPLDPSGVDVMTGIPRKGANADNIIIPIRIFHALLQEMFAHISSMRDLPSDVQLEKIPFDIGPSFIGSHDLRQIEDTDDVGWRTVIHCMASNMRWLSQNVSYLTK